MDLKLALLLVAFFGIARSVPTAQPLHLLSQSAVEAKLEKVFEDYFVYQNDEELKAIANQIQMPDLMSNYGEGVSSLGSELTCSLCRTAANAALFARKSGMNRTSLFNLTTTLCVNLGIESKVVCHGTIYEHLDILLYIIDNAKHLTAKHLCSIFLQSLGCSTETGIDWSIELGDGNSKPLAETSSSGSVKIVQISDLHYDALYNPGANAVCNNPVCCGADSGRISNTSSQAGYWGDYRNCDTPWHTIVNAFDTIKETQTFDYVYFTGDVISHRVWMTSVSDNTKYFHEANDLIDKYFSTSRIFPVLGNHEAHPLNLYPPENVAKEYSNDWLYKLAAEKWGRWLPESTKETIRKGGFYTVKVNDKFRVIVLNSNVCYTANFWLFYDNGDIYGQLAWLRDTLAEAEANGESVHILGHVPTGDKVCYIPWASQYRRIINRYANNIKAIFNGHTHKNEFELFYNTSDASTPIVMAFNGGSISTYSDLNPNFVVYEADTNTMDILDYETYSFNLTAANLAGSLIKPEWFKLYSFKDSYGLQDLKLSTLGTLMEQLAGDKEKAKLYYRNKYKYSDPYLNKQCDDSCLLNNLCSAVSSLYNDNIQCNKLRTLWNSK